MKPCNLDMIKIIVRGLNSSLRLFDNSSFRKLNKKQKNVLKKYIYYQQLIFITYTLWIKKNLVNQNS